MIEGGTTMDLYLREIKGNIPGTGWGKYANKFIEKSGIFMMLAEKFNRASTGLAAFRVAYNEGITLKDGTSTKNDYDKAIRWAKKRVYDAHFLYGLRQGQSLHYAASNMTKVLYQDKVLMESLETSSGLQLDGGPVRTGRSKWRCWEDDVEI